MSATSSQRPWRPDRNGWRFQHGDVTGALRCVNRDVGLSDLRLRGDAIDGELFAVRAASGSLPAAEETYPRGPDLTSIHPPSQEWPFRTLLQWSTTDLNTAGAFAIALTVSLQTDLLDTRPVFELVSTGRKPAVVGAASSGARYAAWVDGDESPVVVVAPFPTDLPEASLIATPTECRVRLAPTFLEKGVIRRCRVGLLLLPPNGAAAETRIEKALAEFAERPAPLTA